LRATATADTALSQEIAAAPPRKSPWQLLLEPPAAPVTYRALTRIHLHADASPSAGVLPNADIEEGATFRAVEAREVGGMLFLKADTEHGSGWLIDTGMTGTGQGQKVLEKVPTYELRASGALQVEDFALDGTGIPPGSLFYLPDFITASDEEEMQHDIDSTGKRLGWIPVTNRRMQGLGAPGALPPFLERLSEVLTECGAVPSGYYPNHCLVNDYTQGHGISPHSDPDRFTPHVAILSLLDSTYMEFARVLPYTISGAPRHRVVLAPRSLLVFRGAMFTDWTHEIPEMTEDAMEKVDWHKAGVPAPRRCRRLSLTMRREVSWRNEATTV